MKPEKEAVESVINHLTDYFEHVKKHYNQQPVAVSNAIWALKEWLNEYEDWQPIEAAPLDGTPVDLWVIQPDPPYGFRSPNCRYGIGKVNTEPEWLDSMGWPVEAFVPIEGKALIRPTHFRLIPQPPEGGTDD